MADWFGSSAMAEGYARARPALHGRILERALGGGRVGNALDLGCGSGLSTAPLERYARTVTGVDPNERMLRVAARIAPGADYVAGQAEMLPFEAESFDLVTAAGSLNFTEFERSFPEVRRVLRRGGRLLIYDFAQGSEFRDSAALEVWHAEFKRRYPTPVTRGIDPGSLGAERWGLGLVRNDEFVLVLTIDPEFYIRYALTETNVQAAIAAGASEAEIRGWCEDTLGPVFGGVAHEVLFRGYSAWFERTGYPVANL